MGNLQKALLLLALPLLLIFIGWNAYRSQQNHSRISSAAAQRTNAMALQADISRLRIALDDLERGQQGYILTEDVSYLGPYQTATAALRQNFPALRSDLERMPQAQQSLAKIEELVKAKEAEAEQTIHWRQQGYRHRAFVMVESGEGKKLTDAARQSLASLSSMVAANFTGHNQEVEAIDTAARSSVSADMVLFAALLLVYAVLILFVRRTSRDVTDATAARSQMQERLEHFRSAIAHDLRGLVDDVHGCAERLLSVYGDFLPLQGQQYAQRLKDTAEDMDKRIEAVLESAGKTGTRDKEQGIGAAG